MHSPQEPASVACNYKQGELFYSVGNCISQLTPIKVERGFGEKKKNEGEWSGKGDNIIRTREKFQAVDGACVPIQSDLLQGLNGEVSALGSQPRGP